MQKARFNQLIQDMRRLPETDALELQQLAEKYPWFQAPYILLAKKYHIDNNPLYDTAVKKAATYIYDRSILFKLIEKTPLTLPIHTIHEVAEPLGKITVESDLHLEVKPIDNETKHIYYEQMDETDLPAIEAKTTTDNGPDSISNAEEPVFEFNDYEARMLRDTEQTTFEQLVKDVTGRVIIPEEKAEADDALTFVEWLRILGGESKAKLVEPTDKHKPVQITSHWALQASGEFNEDKAAFLAAKSNTFHDNLVTETYAAILAGQGKKQKAIEMYERLRLKYPDKSTYFAQKIEELNT
jgi:hypothetical protein